MAASLQAAKLVVIITASAKEVVFTYVCLFVC